MAAVCGGAARARAWPDFDIVDDGAIARRKFGRGAVAQSVTIQQQNRCKHVAIRARFNGEEIASEHRAQRVAVCELARGVAFPIPEGVVKAKCKAHFFVPVSTL